MEHGLYVLEGKAVYRLNEDWVEVEAGDYMWLRAFCPQVEADVFAVLTVEGSLASRNHIGGTAPAQVRAAIARARQRLG